MSNEETKTTPHAMDVMTVTAEIEQTLDYIQEASVDLRSVLEVAEPTVTVSKNTLKRVLDGLNTLRQQMKTLLQAQTRQEKSSLVALYYGVLLGGLIGVIGNFFVQLFFVEVTFWTWVGLLFSGALFLLICALLFFQAKKYAS